MEYNSVKNSEVSLTGPDVKEADNLSKKIKIFTDDLFERYKHSRVELAECRDRIEELKFHHDKEKAAKERAFEVLAAYVKQTKDERQQYVQQINSLENIVMMLMMKIKNSAGHASILEEKMDSSTNNKPTTSRKSNFESYSSNSEEVDISMSSKNLASSIIKPRQAWIDTDLPLEEVSLFEELDEIHRVREKNREMNTLTGRISLQDKYASRLEKRLQELNGENEHLQSHCDFMMRRLIDGYFGMNTGQANKVNTEAENTETRVKPAKTVEIENDNEKENKVHKSDATVSIKETPVSTHTSINLAVSSAISADSNEPKRPRLRAS